MTMDSDLSRQVAEAMGLQECPTFAGKNPLWLNLRRHFGECTPPPNDILGSQCLTPIVGRPFDLADARDREAAIEWLNAKGLRVTAIHIDTVTAYVRIWDKDGTISEAGPCPIEEAFGRAFLGAVGAQG